MPTTPSQYSGLPNKLVRAANGVDYAYRDSDPMILPHLLLPAGRD